MTVASQTSRISYTGNGATVFFDVPFYFLENSHLRVVLRSSTGVETVQTITTNYTVSGAGNPAGGQIAMVIAPPPSSTLLISRNVPVTQETDYQANDPFPAESHERALDKLTMIAQQSSDTETRSIKIPETETSNTLLPITATRANKLLGFDVGGNVKLSTKTMADYDNTVDNFNNLVVGAPQGNALLVQYNPAGSGAVTTNVQAKLREFVSIKDFGAVGDGVTDDAPALRTAMAALNAAGGGQLLIPPGTYRLASFVQYGSTGRYCFSPLYPNISVQGVGGQSILKAGNGTLNSIQNANFFIYIENSAVDFFKFNSITFDHNGANNLYPSGGGYYPMVAVSIQQSASVTQFIDYIEISYCYFLNNAGRNALTFVDEDTSVTNQEYIRYVNITNNTFHNFGYTVANGLNSNNNDHSCLYIQAQECVINDNIFSNDYFDPNTTDVAAAFDHHAAYCTFNNNVMYNNTYCIAHQNSGVGIKYTNISNNIARCAMFYKLFDGAGGGKGEMIFANNNIGWIAAPGFDAAVWDLYNAESSDPLASPSFDVSIIGNTVVNDGGNFAGLQASIIDIKRSDNLVIHGNQFNNAPGRCVYIRPTGRINYVKIEDNEFHYYGIGNVAGTKVGVDLDYTNVNIPANTGTVVVRNNVFRRGSSPTAIEAGVKFNGTFANLTIMGNLYSNVGTENATSLLNATSYQIEGNSQVSFLASVNLSSDPNVLDDYEEGTWTPTISNAGDATVINNAAGFARYTKVGNTVTVNVSFEASALGASPQFDFSLPFVPNSTQSNISAFGFGSPYSVRWNGQVIGSNAMRMFAFSTAAGTHNVAICFSYQTN